MFSQYGIFVKNYSKKTQVLIHPHKFFDENTFYNGIEWARKESKPFSYRVLGGIIPHHLFPSFLIADFFARLPSSIKTVILIGPNHNERGNFKALTSILGWQTPFGTTLPDEIIIKELIKNNLVKINEEILPNDHAVAGIIPFVKYYLPDAKVVPILLSGFMKQEEVAVLANNLKNHIDEETIVVAPVDFSHYLTSSEAAEKDKVSLEVIKDFDFRKLFSLNNDYLDSPPSIAALLMIMQKLETTNMDVLNHTNSGILQNNNLIQTTSYFSIAYH